MPHSFFVERLPRIHVHASILRDSLRLTLPLADLPYFVGREHRLRSFLSCDSPRVVTRRLVIVSQDSPLFLFDGFFSRHAGTMKDRLSRDPHIASTVNCVSVPNSLLRLILRVVSSNSCAEQDSIFPQSPQISSARLPLPERLPASFPCPPPNVRRGTRAIHPLLEVPPLELALLFSPTPYYLEHLKEQSKILPGGYFPDLWSGPHPDNLLDHVTPVPQASRDDFPAPELSGHNYFLLRTLS